MKPRSVLFVLEHFHPNVGGAETLFADLATTLATAGIEVRVVTSRPPRTARREVWKGIEIVRVGAPSLGRRYVFTLAAIAAAIRFARRADLVHTTTYNAAIPAWIAARLWRKPVCITVLEVFARQWNMLPGMNRLLGYGYRFFEWAVLHLPFDVYICPSNFTRSRLLETMSVPDAKTVTVYAGVDEEFWRRDRHDARALRRELGLPDDTVIYLYFGRPGVSKGVEFLVDAVPLVRKELPGSKLVLIMTDDPPRQAMRIRERIAERGVTGDVIILPPQTREALAGALLASDCVVVPSLSEGFGYAAVEAAMLGCNVVTTSGHAVEEVIPNNAVFAAPRDATALARAIVDAVTSPNRERPPLRFPIDRSVQGVLAAYERIADYP